MSGFNRAQLLAAVRQLGFPAGEWLVHGSAALLARELIPVANDIDIAATGAAWQHALTLGPLEQGARDQLVRPAPDIEVFSGWLGADMQALLRDAELLDGVPFASLQAVLDFKLQLRRPKDEAHIALLRRELGLQPSAVLPRAISNNDQP